MFKKIILSLLFTLVAGAEGELLKASLRFQIWVPQSAGGIMIEADPSLKREPIKEELLIQQGDSFLAFRCGELRKSAAVDYIGQPELVVWRAGEAGEKVEVARCELPTSGKYRVILMKSGNGYQALPIPLDSEALSKGEIQMVNTTQRAIVVQQHENRALLLRKGVTKTMKLANPHQPTVHLTIKTLRESKWVAEYSRPYTLCRNARSVCFFYETQSSRRLQMKFFSGL